MNQGLTIYKNFTGDTIYSLQIHQKRPSCPTCGSDNNNAFIGLSEYTIPFMFTRDASTEEVATFTIKNQLDDTVVETLSNDLISIVNAGSIDYISCNFANYDIADPLPCGLYYYEITMNSEMYYSEVFNVIDKEPEFKTEDVAVNGDFATDLSGWTTVGSVSQITPGGSGAAQLVYPSSMYQNAPAQSLVRVVVTTTATYTSGMFFSYGNYHLVLAVGVNTFYVPSGVRFTISNEDIGSVNDLVVDSVQIFEIEKVECYNLIVARNSCNKNSIPYVETAYTDVIIFDAELAEPEYLRDDEFDENGNKQPSQTFLKIQKLWALQGSTALYEPLIDELNKLPLCDCIYIFNDVWKKEFRSYQSTLEIEIPQPEWEFDLKCNATVTLVIRETIAISNSCCEDIDGLGCCESFLWDLDAGSYPIFSVDVAVGQCLEGTNYYVDTYDGADLIDSDIMVSDGVDYTITKVAGIGLTYTIRGSKFGCPDIEYDLNVS